MSNPTILTTLLTSVVLLGVSGGCQSATPQASARAMPTIGTDPFASADDAHANDAEARVTLAAFEQPRASVAPRTPGAPLRIALGAGDRVGTSLFSGRSAPSGEVVMLSSLPND